MGFLGRTGCSGFIDDEDILQNDFTHLEIFKTFYNGVIYQILLGVKF